MRMGCAGYRIGNDSSGPWIANAPDSDSSTPESKITNEKKITSCLTIRRQKLQQVLYESIPSEKIHFNHQFDHCYQTCINGLSHITVVFKVQSAEPNSNQDHPDPSSTSSSPAFVSYTGRLLVAADGIHSAIRIQIFPEIKPIYCGYSYFRAITNIDAFKYTQHSIDCNPSYMWPLSSPSTAFESWADGHRFAYVPMPHHEAFWFASIKMPLMHTKPTATKKQTASSFLAPFASFDSWHQPIPTLLYSTPASDVIFTPIHKVDLPSKQWKATARPISINDDDIQKATARPISINDTSPSHYEDSTSSSHTAFPSSEMMDIATKTPLVVFLGDAAHAVPPNLAAGGMMAMQDAIQLASEIKKRMEEIERKKLDNESLTPALDAYITARRFPVKLVQISSSLISSFGHQKSPQWFVDARNWILVSIIPTRFKNFIFSLLHRLYLGWNYTTPRIRQEIGLYERLMGRSDWRGERGEPNDFSGVPSLLRHFHSLTVPSPPSSSTSHLCSGSVSVRRGNSLAASFLCKLVSLPPAMVNATVEVEIKQKTDDRNTEEWIRTYTAPSTGKQYIFRSTQYIQNSYLIEAVDVLALFPKLTGIVETEFQMIVHPMYGGEEITGNNPSPSVLPSTFPPICIGFRHLLVYSRLRLFSRWIKGGITFPIPLPQSWLPQVSATTVVNEPKSTSTSTTATATTTTTMNKYQSIYQHGMSWTFDVSVKAPNFAITRWLMNAPSPSSSKSQSSSPSAVVDPLEIGGYAGVIHIFNKPGVLKWKKRLQQEINNKKFGNQRRTMRTRSLVSPPSRSFSTSSTPVSSRRRLRVLILGGYGLFGSRIASGLLLLQAESFKLSTSNTDQHLLAPIVYMNARRDRYQIEHAAIMKRVEDKWKHFTSLHSDSSSSTSLPPPPDCSFLLRTAIFDAKQQVNETTDKSPSSSSLLATKLRELEIDVLINCAGPFTSRQPESSTSTSTTSSSTPYQIASTCIDEGVHYFDLADQTDWVCNFSTAVMAGHTNTLQSRAEQKGVIAVTGVSSVPGVSSAAVKEIINQHIAREINHAPSNNTKAHLVVNSIDIGISPGNHTPRGLATMQSILGLTGHPMKWFKQISEEEQIKLVNRISPSSTSSSISSSTSISTPTSPSGSWETIYGWQSLKRSASDSFHSRIMNLPRWLSAVEVPDLKLFTTLFASQLPISNPLSSSTSPTPFSSSPPLTLSPTVHFRAGLETPLLHLGLWLLSWLVRARVINDLSRFAALLKWIAESRIIMQMGSDTGGMFVTVKTTTWKQQEQNNNSSSSSHTLPVHSSISTWQLFVGSGEGVQVPATPSIILVKQLIQAHLAREIQLQSSTTPMASSTISSSHSVTPLPSSLSAGAMPCCLLFSLDDFMNQMRLYDAQSIIMNTRSDLL